MGKRLVRLTIIVGICALMLGVLWIRNSGIAELKNLMGLSIPSPFIGKWVVDTVDGKPVGGEGKPVVLIEKGSVVVNLAGHDELADDLNQSWIKQHLRNYAPSDLKAGAKVTGFQIPRRANPEGRISMRRLN